MYKLFIDDERFPINPDWFVARNSYQAIKAVELYGMPNDIAFDHDLGGQDTSMAFITWLENALIDGKVAFPEGFTYSIHSQNPIGAENIKSRMNQLVEHFSD